jgi:hypothetical protein
MLKTAFSPLIALTLVLAFAGSTGCVSHNPSVKPIPNITVGHTTGEALLVRNATAAPLILLPSQLHAAEPEVVLAPGQSKRLEFALTEEQNKDDPKVSEIVLDEKNSSHYLRQPDTDLVLRARFGSARARKEIRIGIGQCLLHAQAPTGGYPVPVGSPAIARNSPRAPLSQMMGAQAGRQLVHEMSGLGQ